MYTLVLHFLRNVAFEMRAYFIYTYSCYRNVWSYPKEFDFRDVKTQSDAIKFFFFGVGLVVGIVETSEYLFRLLGKDLGPPETNTAEWIQNLKHIGGALLLAAALHYPLKLGNSIAFGIAVPFSITFSLLNLLFSAILMSFCFINPALSIFGLSLGLYFIPLIFSLLFVRWISILYMRSFAEVLILNGLINIVFAFLSWLFPGLRSFLQWWSE
jgi:hypothetical protein